MIHIALDAMGGDIGPAVVVPAACVAVADDPSLVLTLVGDEATITQHLKSSKIKVGMDRIKIHHASEVVEMDEPPALALRNKKDSSMRVAIDLVKAGEAQACVSAGNTGALMATARFVLKTIPGVDRPAICGLLPTRDPNHPVHMLDLGANVDCSAEQLLQFALMGAQLCSSVDGNAHPSVGLLNVGEEDIKGNEIVKQAAHLLQQHPDLNYVGFIEGDAIFKGQVDVVVCDGFVGNIALKTTEGVAKLISGYLKAAFKRSWFTKLCGLATLPVLHSVYKRIDPSRYNGASFLGLRNSVIKSHGGSNIRGFHHAIKKAKREVMESVPERISTTITDTLSDTPAAKDAQS